MSSPNLCSIQGSEESEPSQSRKNNKEDVATDVGELNDLEEENPFQKKKRKKTSPVWEDLKIIIDSKDGIQKFQCIYCKSKLSKQGTGSTTHLKRHMRNCNGKKAHQAKGQQNLSISLTTTQTETVASVQSFKYDHSKIRELLAHLIIVHELPFQFSEYELFNALMRAATPHYEKITRTAVKNDCVASYNIEKQKLMEEIKYVDRVSVTTDLWKSGQNISYMVVTCHYVDLNWNLQKRTINFCDIPPPHTGIAISDTLQRCFSEWGIEEKVWTVTVDNATNNASAMDNLKDNLKFKRTLPLNGLIFHVKCCAHIMNLLVQDGLSAIQPVISKVRDSVKYIIVSEARRKMFGEISKQLQLSSKKLILDCCTRWNATYFMLSSALEFKAMFPRYKQRDPSYKYLPTEEEWDKVKIVCTFLEDFHEITELISGSEYPTSNIFLPKLMHIKSMLTTSADGGSGTPFMGEMVKKMKLKFDKYWGDCNILICIAAVLDPRNKMKYIEWCAANYYSEIEGVELKVTILETLRALYAEYVESYRVMTDSVRNAELDTETSSISNSVTTSVSSKSSRSDLKYVAYMQTVASVDEVKSDLDLYLEEGVLLHTDKTPFDVINWWKTSNLKYRILSKTACDVLSIPMTTVASESAFSAGGRVIDTHRASLGVETVQILLCAGDWLRARYQIKGKAKEDNNDVMKEITWV